MMFVDHEEMVERLARPAREVIEIITEEKTDAMHAAAGIAGEAGEVLDSVKKSFFYGTPLNREVIVEEMGDVEFYLALMRQTLGVSREEVIDGNIAKLNKRYSSGSFSQEQAINRDDKS